MVNQLFEFPFIADVWGTVSDWVMVVVTATTAYFLYRTLQEQKEFTKIELERFSRENPPTFTSTSNQIQKGDGLRKPKGFVIILMNNRLKNLSINLDFPPGCTISNDYRGSKPLEPGSEISFSIKTDESFVGIATCTGRVIFRYDDMFHNRYQQILNITVAQKLSWNPPSKISNSNLRDIAI